MTSALGALVGWSLLASLVVSLGATASRWLVLPRVVAAHPETTWLDPSAARLAWQAGALVPVAMGLFFVRQLAEFRDPFAPLGEDVALLLSTSWGTVWASGMAGSVAAASALFGARRGRGPALAVATLLLLALAVFPALTGHASADRPLRWLAVTADAAHVVAASAWMGGLATVLYLAVRGRRREGGAPFGALVRAFSPMAMACVALLVLTGSFGAWLHVAEPADLIATAYGRVLTLKLLVVAGVMALGALNWRRFTPRLDQPGGEETLRRAASAELLLALVVLFITAVLVRTPPAGM